MEVQKKDNKIYSPIKKEWLVWKPEEEVRQRYICRLCDTYGYTLEQMDQEVQVTNSQRGLGAARADIVVWQTSQDKRMGKAAFIVVECKAENVTIKENDYFQGYNYAAWAGASFFITTNMKETRVFRVVVGEIPKRLVEIVDIPSASSAFDKKKVRELLLQTKSFSRDEFSKLLLKCHNIIRDNDKLSPEAAFDETSKILFIKIRYERDNTGTQVFSREAFKRSREEYNKYKLPNQPAFYQYLFENTKQAYANDNLFEKSDTIKIREDSFEAIVGELEIYNLSTTSDDIKGIAFEKFLGKTFRGELGQYFTPRTVVDFIVSVIDPQEGEYICDPCCGSGGFLIRAFEYVRKSIEDDIERQKTEIRHKIVPDDYEALSDTARDEIDARLSTACSMLNGELDITNAKSRLRSLSFDCIYGTDANARMARTAKMNMIMHGDGHGGVHFHDGLINVNGIWEGRFDVILTNPPFGSHISKNYTITEKESIPDKDKEGVFLKRYGESYSEVLSRAKQNVGTKLLSHFTLGAITGITEALFIERCLNLLKPGGRMAIVLPEGILNNTAQQGIREFVEGKAKILLIVSLPQEVFMAAGATVKASLLFLKKFTPEETEEYQSLLSSARRNAEMKHSDELRPIEVSLSLRGKNAPTAADKKLLRAKLRDIKRLMAKEVKDEVKHKFSYQVPMAEVNKAGISSTGSNTDNELPQLADEYTAYRSEQRLWDSNAKVTSYAIGTEGRVTRIRS